MSCKDCIHFVACVDFWYSDYDCCGNIEQSKQKHANDEVCVHFKPTADVAEVRHGYWIRESFIDKHGEKMFTSPKCSLCDNIETFRSKYCPECGAKMDGERRANDGN